MIYHMLKNKIQLQTFRALVGIQQLELLLIIVFIVNFVSCYDPVVLPNPPMTSTN